MEITDVGFLMDRIRELEKSEENKKRSDLWKPITNTAEAYWHGNPRDSLPCIPFTIEPEHEMWAKILGFHLDEYYSDGKTYLLADLNMKFYRFENFSDGTPIGKGISMWMGAGFEAELFGVEQQYTSDRDPWVGRKPILKDKKDLARLTPPNFYSSPAMARVHRMYDDMKGLLDDDFSAIMPEWCRGPFGLACHLRGMDTIVVDMLQDPLFVHDLLRMTTDARKGWTSQRADFMKVPIQSGSLYNDEVTVPLLSPRLYEEFVLPYEVELSEFYGGITYWHSCGNTTDLQDLIKDIPHLEMIHISPWTSLAKSVVNLSGSDIALEVVLHPLTDIHLATPEEIRSQLTSIRELGQGMPRTVRADGIQVLSTIEDDVKKVKEWAAIAHSILG
jgi:uroporphyrinogen-III decarboxylase